MHNLIKYGLFCAVFSLLFTNCQSEPAEKGSAEHIKAVTSSIDDATLVKAEIDGDWLTYGGNYQEDRYSTLDQIN